MKWDKVYIEITNICNLKCKFCKPVERKLEYMKLDVFEKILKQIQGKTNLVLLHVKGEPMLHPNLKEILELCNEYGIKVNLTTNGTLLKEKIDILTKAESLRQVNISLHSYVENEKVNKNYLSDVFDAADTLKNCYISYRLWNLKDKQENSHNAEILNKLSRHYGFSNLEQEAKKNDYIKLAENVFINQDIEFTWPDLSSSMRNEEGKCYALRKQIAFLVNGDVVPCCLDGDGVLALGNINETTLEEILNTPRVEKMLKGFENHKLCEELCKTCGFAQKLSRNF